jgi:hypothetical protein
LSRLERSAAAVPAPAGVCADWSESDAADPGGAAPDRSPAAETHSIMTRAQTRAPTRLAPAIASFMKTLKVEAVYPMAYETFADAANPSPVRSGLSQPPTVRGPHPPANGQIGSLIPVRSRRATRPLRMRRAKASSPPRSRVPRREEAQPPNSPFARVSDLSRRSRFVRPTQRTCPYGRACRGSEC